LIGDLKMPLENIQDTPAVFAVSCAFCDDSFLLPTSEMFTYSRGWGWLTDAAGRASFFVIGCEKVICAGCIRECVTCGNVLTTNSDMDECDDCMFVSCDRCGDSMSRDEVNYSSRTDERFCDVCYGEFLRENERLIENYTYKPEPKFHAVKNEVTKTFFGMELEVESRGQSLENSAQGVKNSLGELAYFKMDGSLNDGFEIVTHPFSFEWYKQNFKFDFLNDLKNEGFRSWDTDTCGLHVHVSKKAFVNDAHVWKFCQLFLKNKSSWVKMAGRSSTRWASYDPERLPVADILKHKKHPERYCAVNLCNSTTIEIRIFRGSLNAVRVQSAIESVAAAVEYTRMINLSDYARHAIDFANFAKFIEVYWDEYPNAFEVIKKKGLI
jgi:hypothetical protein